MSLQRYQCNGMRASTCKSVLRCTKEQSYIVTVTPQFQLIPMRDRNAIWHLPK